MLYFIVSFFCEGVIKLNNSKAYYINGDEYFQSSVLIPFIMYNNEYYIILEKRSAHISQAGEVCFPGGKFDTEVDKNTKDTAIRETCEELGTDKSQIKNVKFWGTYIAPMATLIDVYIGFLSLDNPYSLPINKSEVEKLLVIPFSYFKNTPPNLYEIDSWSYPYRKSLTQDKLTIFPTKELGLPAKYHKPWKGKPRKVYVYPTDDVPIWGVTANIIKEFVNQYQEQVKLDSNITPLDFFSTNALASHM